MSFLWRNYVLLLVTPLFLVGCASLVPKDGPALAEVEENASVTLERTAPSVNYALLRLSPLILEQANAPVPDSGGSFLNLPRANNPTDVRIGTGDLLSLTIFESQAGGLFIPTEAGSRAGNFVSVPNQQVDATGNIVVPYAGVIKAVGRTASDVSAEIAKKLGNRAIEPQIVVTIAERRGNEVSVLGEVNTPLRFAIDPGGITALGAIARAAGPKNPSYETIVSIQRRGHTIQMPMTDLIKSPKFNIQIAPQDVIYLSREQKVFLTLGSTPSPGSVGGINNRRFAFDNDNMSLSEAIAKSGGLDPLHANSSAVFVFRMEPKLKLAQMGVDTSEYTQTMVPTIYEADWSKADAFFLSNNFFVRDKDLIFVSEHPASDFVKFVNIVRSVTDGVGNTGQLISATR